MTRARLSFPRGDPIEVELDDVKAYGPKIRGFRAFLGAVNASAAGRWVLRVGDEEEILGFRRDELRRVRLTDDGAELTFAGDVKVTLREADVYSWSPEPDDVRSWLGRLAHGKGEAWIRLRDGSELRFPIGDGPHVQFLERRDHT
ncbi:MAG TPA: hypothetical protein VFM93_14345 [Candidatus Limnocylindria bacterium]|nr:hypothetical protein [Candidatus Limnocylindria bacterium]